MATDATIRLKQINSTEVSGYATQIIQGVLANPLTTIAATGNLTSVFYPLDSNPAGYLKSGDVVSHSELDSAVTQLTYTFGQSADYINGQLKSNDGSISVDWQNRNLSGDWTLNGQTISGGNGGSLSPNIVYTTGNQTINGYKTFSGYIIGKELNVTNDVASCIAPTAGYLGDFTLTQDYPFKTMAMEISLDWKNHRMFGDWNCGNFTTSNIYASKISGTTSPFVIAGTGDVYTPGEIQIIPGPNNSGTLNVSGGFCAKDKTGGEITMKDGVVFLNSKDSLELNSDGPIEIFTEHSPIRVYGAGIGINNNDPEFMLDVNGLIGNSLGPCQIKSYSTVDIGAYWPSEVQDGASQVNLTAQAGFQRAHGEINLLAGGGSSEGQVNITANPTQLGSNSEGLVNVAAGRFLYNGLQVATIKNTGIIVSSGKPITTDTYQTQPLPNWYVTHGSDLNITTSNGDGQNLSMGGGVIIKPGSGNIGGFVNISSASGESRNGDISISIPPLKPGQLETQNINIANGNNQSIVIYDAETDFNGFNQFMGEVWMWNSLNVINGITTPETVPLTLSTSPATSVGGYADSISLQPGTGYYGGVIYLTAGNGFNAGDIQFVAGSGLNGGNHGNFKFSIPTGGGAQDGQFSVTNGSSSYTLTPSLHTFSGAVKFGNTLNTSGNVICHSGVSFGPNGVSAQIDASGNVSGKVVTATRVVTQWQKMTSNFTLTGTIGVNSIYLLSGSSITGKLPVASGLYEYTFKQITSGTGVLTGYNASDRIDGQTTYKLSGQYKYVSLMCDGVGNWFVIGNN